MSASLPSCEELRRVRGDGSRVLIEKRAMPMQEQDSPFEILSAQFSALKTKPEKPNEQKPTNRQKQ